LNTACGIPSIPAHSTSGFLAGQPRRIQFSASAAAVSGFAVCF
jgi:hypothetical protein